MRVTHPTTDQSHYCPLGKVMDSIQSERLLSYLNRNHALNKHQFGFLPDRSTVTQLVYVVDTWLRALDNGEKTSTIFMDFQKAFDRVWHATLLHKLSTSVPGRPTQEYILAIKLSDRQNNRGSRWLVFIITKYHLCQSSPRFPPGTGFVLVFINDLPDHVHIPTELYADDALLHHTFKRSTTALSARGALQTAVLAAEQWALQWQGRFAHAKTKQLNLGQTQNLPLATTGIEDYQTEEVVRHKHLEITFTSDLKWNARIQEVIGNAAKREGLF